MLTSLLQTLLALSIMFIPSAHATEVAPITWESFPIQGGRYSALITSGVLSTKTKLVFRVTAEKMPADPGSKPVQIAICDSNLKPITSKDREAIWTYAGLNQQEEVEIPSTQKVLIVVGHYGQSSKMLPPKFLRIWDPKENELNDKSYRLSFLEPEGRATVDKNPNGTALEKQPMRCELEISVKLKHPEF